MKVWRVQSFDHRMLDQADESDRCEYFATSRDGVMRWIREQVRDRLHWDQSREPDIYDPSPPSQESVEVVVEKITMPAPTRTSVIACLNRTGWMEKSTRTTIWLDKNGREVKK